MLKFCTQYASKFGKLSSGHRTGRVFILIWKTGNDKECSNFCTIVLISHASKEDRKSVKLGFNNTWTGNFRHTSWVSKGQRNQKSNCQHLLDHRQSKGIAKNFCFIDNAKAFDCVDHNKLWRILKETETPEHLTCLLENLYAGQEATVRNGLGKMDWFKIGKGVHKGCILSPCLFNLDEEYVM